jgi:hypothetical protein
MTWFNRVVSTHIQSDFHTLILSTIAEKTDSAIDHNRNYSIFDEHNGTIDEIDLYGDFLTQNI